MNEITNTIKKEVTRLYDTLDINLDTNKYDRIINMVTHAIVDEPISMNDKLKIYCAALLYPTINSMFQDFDNNIARKILSNVDLSPIVNNDHLKFVDNVVDEINKNIIEKEGIIYEAIQVDPTNPEALIDYAYKLLKKDIPLYTKRAPYIKDISKIERMCCPKDYFRSFMEYIYHVALFLPKTNTNIKNPYLIQLLNHNKQKMKSLCLKFGNEESITFENLKQYLK